MSQGFDEVIKQIQGMKEALPNVARDVVTAVCGEIYEQSQAIVPVDTGLLKSTGTVSIEAEGTRATGTVSYGSGATVTEWHGVGYEVFVHTPGTRHYGGVPYLSAPAEAVGAHATEIAAQIITAKFKI